MALSDVLGDKLEQQMPRALEVRVTNDLDTTQANVDNVTSYVIATNPEIRALFAPAYENPQVPNDQPPGEQPSGENTTPSEPLPEQLRDKLNLAEISRHIDFLHAHQPTDKPGIEQ